MEEPEKKTNGKRNKNAGHSWEREIIKLLKEKGFPHVVSTRSESRNRDADKVDIMNKDEHKNGRLPVNIQAKCLAKPVVYYKVLSEMPDGEQINVIFHKQTKKAENGRFMATGTYAISNLDSYLDLLGEREKYRKAYELLNNYFDSIDDEEQKKVNKELEKLGL